MKLYAENPEGNAKGDTFHFVYLHRKLETLNGFDIVNIEGEEPEVGIHDVSINIKGKDYDALLFYWQPKDYPNKKGLIVAKDDDKGILEARLAYNNRKRII